MVRSLKALSTVKHAAQFGIDVGDPRLDWNKVLARKNQVIGELVGDREMMLQKAGIAYHSAGASFLAGNELLVGETRIHAEKILIAAGSKPATPPIPGIEHTINSDQALELKSLPQSLIIVGGGFIALELGYVFSEAGVDLKIIEATERLLPNADGEISEAIQQSFRQRGTGVYTSSKVESIHVNNGQRVVTVNLGENVATFAADMVLVATGRTPNVDDLNLNAAGIKYSKKGILVNQYLQTSNPAVYAIGDITGGLMFTPVASYEARYAVKNALEGNVAPADYRIVPSAVFTEPTIAGVGLTEAQAQYDSIDYTVSRSYFEDNGAAVIEGQPEGFVKLLIDNSDHIIGGHIIGAGAPEIIMEVALAMRGGLTVQELHDTIHIHPTFAEAVARAAGT